MSRSHVPIPTHCLEGRPRTVHREEAIDEFVQFRTAESNSVETYLAPVSIADMLRLLV